MHDLILLRRCWVGIGHRMDRRRCIVGVLHHRSRRRPDMGALLMT